MKEFLINHLEYRVFDSRKDQLKNNSLYHSELKDNEVLFEIVEEKGGVKKLVGFRIYSKDIVNDNNVSSLVDEIIKDGGYFSERIDKKYVYISRFDGF